MLLYVISSMESRYSGVNRPNIAMWIALHSNFPYVRLYLIVRLNLNYHRYRHRTVVKNRFVCGGGLSTSWSEFWTSSTFTGSNVHTYHMLCFEHVFCLDFTCTFAQDMTRAAVVWNAGDTIVCLKIKQTARRPRWLRGDWEHVLCMRMYGTYSYS